MHSYCIHTNLLPYCSQFLLHAGEVCTYVTVRMECMDLCGMYGMLDCEENRQSEAVSCIRTYIRTYILMDKVNRRQLEDLSV